MEFSDLYCRYNGFMLGQFLHQCERSYTEARYDLVRKRVHEFLEEVGVVFHLPDTRSGFKDSADNLGVLTNSMYNASLELGRSFCLGYFVTEYFMNRLFGRRTSQNVLGDLWKWSEHFGVKRRSIEKIASEPPRNRETIAANDLLTGSLAYLRELLVSASADPHAAFVAIPFQEPYLARYRSIFSPALERCGYRPIRAWGGLSDEIYSTMMLELIGKCGILLADLSERNLNVLYEVGVAHGQGKDAILLADKRESEVPSNLGEFWVKPYSTTGDDWQTAAIDDIRVVIVAMQAAVATRRRREARSARIKGHAQ